MNAYKRSPIWVFCVFIFALSVASCAGSRQARNVEFAGFLGDYSRLEAGGQDEALMNFLGQKTADVAAMARYDSVVLDPVVYFSNPEDIDLSPEDRKLLVDKFYAILVRELGTDYEIVDQPNGSTLRVSIAVTSAERDLAVLDTVSTIIPIGLVASTAVSRATDSSGFSGEIAAEGKITDATTGELIAAAVDRRLGAKTLDANVFSSWQTIDDSLNYWAQLIRFRLCEWRAGDACVTPG